MDNNELKPFADQHDLQQAITSDLYHRSPAFRDEVQQRLALTPGLSGTHSVRDEHTKKNIASEAPQQSPVSMFDGMDEVSWDAPANPALYTRVPQPDGRTAFVRNDVLIREQSNTTQRNLAESMGIKMETPQEAANRAAFESMKADQDKFIERMGGSPFGGTNPLN